MRYKHRRPQMQGDAEVTSMHETARRHRKRTFDEVLLSFFRSELTPHPRSTQYPPEHTTSSSFNINSDEFPARSQTKYVSVWRWKNISPVAFAAEGVFQPRLAPMHANQL